MRTLFSPPAKLSFGLTAFTVSLGLVAYALGLMPNSERAMQEARASIAEALSPPLAALLEHGDTQAMKDIIDPVVARRGLLSAVAVSGPNGAVLAQSRAGPAAASVKDRVEVRLGNGKALLGKIEFEFRPPAEDWPLWRLPGRTIALFGFVIVAGYLGFFFYLKRALRVLSAEDAVPERVASAFDALSEGVLILSVDGYILLANQGFTRDICRSEASLVGSRVDELPWIIAGEPGASEFPWQAAVKQPDPVVGCSLAIKYGEAAVRQLVVNATRIEDASRAVQGVIVTFDDLTDVHNANEELNRSIEQLKAFQSTIETQNLQLKRLATRDPLTDSLNRRAFFAEFETAMRQGRSGRDALSLLMMDVDHFKSINDRFGHAVGDKALIGLVEILNAACREGDFVGRYGGEEFCIFACGRDDGQAEAFANEVRLRVANAPSLLPNGQAVTVSVGVVAGRDFGEGPEDCVKRADEALYAAKAGGRNKVVNWRALQTASAAIDGPLEREARSRMRS